MKCSNCPQFTSKDTDAEPEGELEVSDDGMVSGDVRIHNDCAECGGELEETSFTVEIDLTAEVAQHMADKHADVLAERAKPKPKAAKPKPIDPASVDQFARCRTCRRYWLSHYVPGKKHGSRVNVMNPAQSFKTTLRDARKALCVNGEGTFDPAPIKSTDAHDVELSVETDITRTDETQRTDRKGRVIRNHRYMKRLYGVQVEATVKCDTCGVDIASGSYSDAVQASGMEWIG